MRRNGDSFCLLMLDIDHFKRVNDEYGHDAGDRVLQQVALQIVSQVRAGDLCSATAARSFWRCWPRSTRERAPVVAEKIRQRIQDLEVSLAGGRSIRVSISIGLATNDGHLDYQRLIERADQALYAAKNAGRNRIAQA